VGDCVSVEVTDANEISAFQGKWNQPVPDFHHRRRDFGAADRLNRADHE
jgi:hypothetical protein